MKSYQTKKFFLFCVIMVVLGMNAPRAVAQYSASGVMNEINKKTQAQAAPLISLQGIDSEGRMFAGTLKTENTRQIDNVEKEATENDRARDSQLARNQENRHIRRSALSGFANPDPYDSSSGIGVMIPDDFDIDEPDMPPKSEGNADSAVASTSEPKNGKKPTVPNPKTTPKEPSKQNDGSPANSISEKELPPGYTKNWKKGTPNGRTFANRVDRAILFRYTFPTPLDLYDKEHNPERYNEKKRDYDEFVAKFQKKHGPGSEEYKNASKRWRLTGNEPFDTGSPFVDEISDAIRDEVPGARLVTRNTAATMNTIRRGNYSKYLNERLRLEYRSYRLKKINEGDLKYSYTLRDEDALREEWEAQKNFPTPSN